MSKCKINAKSALERAHIKKGKYQEDSLNDAYLKINKAVEEGQTETFITVPVEFRPYVIGELATCGFKTRIVERGYTEGIEVWWDESERLKHPVLSTISALMAIGLVVFAMIKLVCGHC